MRWKHGLSGVEKDATAKKHGSYGADGAGFFEEPTHFLFLFIRILVIKEWALLFGVGILAADIICVVPTTR